MEITTRSLWTLIHGMGFGALYLLACSGAIVLLYLRFSTDAESKASPAKDRFLGIYLTVMAALAWLAVLTGTYIIYPWYRATAPAGTSDLAGFPRALLLSHPATKQWHLIGMEWKEHIAWLVPIAITMAASIAIKYARYLRNHPQLRYALHGFVITSLFAAGVAGFFGAMLSKNAPVDGGPTIQLVQGEKP
ncbi:MAG: hypothetical protein ABSB60_18440 [Terracidiphilus sp.]|jgi:hypothetical protein